ncbi:MAG TPA: type II toxin-antitoxin system RelE/ParE family toxin [Hellea balneolensis]|uniref:Type II toxin-antitoxin system RelE/ParE family toxin n=1 Tax=Hellea balneolensis TaxID=287478 RepID=A0A7V5U0U1_9PROT|nr:type II toxin-antitoxin system RelE/ParE family toxin [Hellea balneolensis]
MRTVRFRARAIQNINRQIAYFDENAPHIIEPFRADMRTTISLVQTFPHIGHKGEVDGTREIISIKFRYIIVYVVREDFIEVLRVFFKGQNRQDKNG